MKFRDLKARPVVHPVPEGVRGVLLNDGELEFFQLLGFVYSDEEYDGFFLPVYLDLNGKEVVFIADRFNQIWGGRDCLEGMELTDWVEWTSKLDQWA